MKQNLTLCFLGWYNSSLGLNELVQFALLSCWMFVCLFFFFFFFAKYLVLKMIFVIKFLLQLTAVM